MGIGRVARVRRGSRVARGVLTPPVTPTLVSAEIGNNGADSLILVFSADMAGDGSGFTLSASGGPVNMADIFVYIANQTWQSNTDRAIAHGETITLDYTPGNMHATVGGASLGAISGFTVTNNVA